MKKGIIYARFSCGRQTEQSIEGQLRKCHEFAKKNEEKQAELIAKLEYMIEQLTPLLQLPKAFIQTVINNPESVKSGVAKKVSDILEVNTDNVEKNNKVGE